MPGIVFRDHEATRLLSKTKRRRTRKRASWAIATEQPIPPTTRFVTIPSPTCLLIVFLLHLVLRAFGLCLTHYHSSSSRDGPSMAPTVVGRIREKISRKRHSFTGSLRSARSTASSIKSKHSHSQPDYRHDEHDEPKQSRSITPNQLASQIQLTDHDLDLSTSSSSTASTTTTTIASQDHGDEKPQEEHDSQDEIPDREKSGRHLTETLEEETGDSEGEGGAASEGPGLSLTASMQVQPAKTTATGTGDAKAAGSTAVASTGVTAEESTEESTDASIGAPTGAPTGITAGAPTGTAATDATGLAVVAPAAVLVVSDPPNRHQPPSLPTSPPSTSTPPSSAASSTAPSHKNLTLSITSTQKPVPPPLARQNSWQYRRSLAQQLQSIDEDSDPPSPTTVTSATKSDRRVTSVADTSVTSTSDDSSSGGSSGEDDNDDDNTSDDNYQNSDKRRAQIKDSRRKKKASAHCPRSRHANIRHPIVTVTEPPTSHPPQTQTQTRTPFQFPGGLAAVEALTTSLLEVAVVDPSPSTSLIPAAAATAKKRSLVHIPGGGVVAVDALSTQLLQAAAAAPRKQSLFDSRHTLLIKTLLENYGPTDDEDDTASIHPVTDTQVPMTTRKIWVKRPGASATLVTIKEDDLVDDVRDTILAKYGNSLGKTFDSPDLTLRIVPREQSSQKERLLGPEEHMCRTLDTYFPGSQTVNEALLIDTPPPRRNPRPSPRVQGLYPVDSIQPPENGEGYFPPVTVGGMPSPQRGIILQAPPATTGPTHSIAVLNTGHIPNIPSPGGSRPRYNREQTNRPKLNRTHTQSPTIAGVSNPSSSKASGSEPSGHGRPTHSRAQSNSSDHQKATGGPPLPGSPVIANAQQSRVATPPPRVTSPRSSASKFRKVKKVTAEPHHPNMLNGSVPPISVLIVEDNPINLKLLEAFVKKLKVRWSTAMNGRDAVTKWRTGGFHLVLMDIQLPVMNGLDATREIRRLERVNTIGVFTSSIDVNGTSSDAGEDVELKEQDRLEDMSLFKSPVIIVALTASSLQSDRHEALAAGCNDFLTKVCATVHTARRTRDELTLPIARQLCLAREKDHGMGLHASAH